MFGSFLYQFKNKIAYSPAIGEVCGGGAIEDDPCDVIDLGTIQLEEARNTDEDDDDDRGGGSTGGGGGNSNSNPTIEIIGVEHVETAIISASGASSISGPVTLLIANEY